MRQLPHLNELAAKPGLHVVGLYSQVHELSEVEAMLTKQGVKYPNTPDSDIFVPKGYAAPGLPKVWIVGVDGKFIFVGGKGYDEILEKELAKVKYPGLGRGEVHKDVEPAAKAYGEGKYAEAYKLAEAVYDNTEDDEAEEDADYIMERISDRISTLEVRAETAEVIKNYATAIACWTELATGYKGHEDTEEAPERLKKLTESDEVKKDIAARRELLKLMLSLDVGFQKVDQTDPDAVEKFRRKCLDEYRKFYAENKSNSAGDRTETLIGIFEALLPEESKETPKEDPKGEKPGTDGK